MVERSFVIAGVATAAALAVTPALAAPDPARALEANSYAELLQPVPDAQAKLAALDAQRAPTQHPAAQGEQVAQYYYYHHHHHWRGYYPLFPYWRRHYYHHHHHHHHHHHGYYQW